MRAKKSFGQNFLTDKNIVIAAGVKPDDVVLEIGPGRGILTAALLGAGAEVIAVELDDDLIQPLSKLFPLSRDSRVGGQGWGYLIHGDILKDEVWIRIRKLIGRKKYQVVANIPYNITSPILETLFRVNPRPERLTLMVQREVADRILAKPPKMSVLSVACQLYSEGKKLFQVSRGSFYPIPKVDSTVIRLDLRNPLPFGEGQGERLKFPIRRAEGQGEGSGEGLEEAVLKIVKAGFSARRKQLHGNLSKQNICSSQQVKDILKSLGLDEKSRAENLTVDDWIKVFHNIKTSKKCAIIT
jgi:16S rRNA (adenine1518-N6/adenine1519-N6)-dimethyltransferase